MKVDMGAPMRTRAVIHRRGSKDDRLVVSALALAFDAIPADWLLLAALDPTLAAC